MKYMKPISFLLCLLLVCALMLSACGGQESGPAGSEPAPEETTVVIETTAEGGTVEQDAEGNKITRNENGDIIAVENTEGEAVDIGEYISAHAWIVSGSSSGGQADSASSAGSSSSGGSGNRPNGSTDSTASDPDSADSKDNSIEESIPVIIVTIPDDEDLIELPEL